MFNHYWTTKQWLCMFPVPEGMPWTWGQSVQALAITKPPNSYVALSRFFHFSNLWFRDSIYLPSMVVIGNNINHVFRSNLHPVNSFLGRETKWILTWTQHLRITETHLKVLSLLFPITIWSGTDKRESYHARTIIHYKRIHLKLQQKFHSI